MSPDDDPDYWTNSMSHLGQSQVCIKSKLTPEKYLLTYLLSTIKFSVNFKFYFKQVAKNSILRK